MLLGLLCGVQDAVPHGGTAHITVIIYYAYLIYGVNAELIPLLYAALR
jgi:hypothetical protein